MRTIEFMYRMTGNFEMNTEQHVDATGAVSNLVDDLADALNGYDTIREKADSGLEKDAERLYELHQRHASALMEWLAEHGGQPDRPGSMMGAVHTAVASARNWFGKLDESAKSGIVDGENRLIDSYNEAQKNAAPDSDLHDLLSRQREELQAQINTMKTA